MKLIQASRTNRDVDLDDGLDEHVDRRLAVSSKIAASHVSILESKSVDS
jgi:hypothetical protein